MMDKRYLRFALLATLFFLLCPEMLMANEPADTGRQGWLLGIIFKLEKMRDKEIADIRKYDAEIQKCNATIRAADGIISKAQQKGNAEAEKIARSALITAQEAKRKNEKLKSLSELRKQRAETAYASVYNQLSKEAGSKEEIRGVVSGVSGNAFILSKRDKETIPLAGDRAGYLSPGDEIWTLGKSNAEIQMLNGRGSLRLGEYSRFKVEQDSVETQAINLMNGKIYVAIDKIDEYEKMVDEKIRAYKEDLKTIKTIEDEIKSKIMKWQKRFEVRVSAVPGQRASLSFLSLQMKRKAPK